MKNMKKTLTAAIAAVIASATVISTASAATYIDIYGNTYYDGINDGMVYCEDYTGAVYAYQDSRYTSRSTTYIGEDAFYSSIYYDSSCGSYAHNSADNYTYLGWNFALSRYVGTDRRGRKVYYNDAIGYFVINGNSCTSFGFSSSAIEW